jgi:hypothetical protein
MKEVCRLLTQLTPLRFLLSVSTLESEEVSNHIVHGFILPLWKAHFAACTIQVSLATVCITFLLLPLLGVCLNFSGISLMGSALAAAMQTPMQGHSVDLSTWSSAPFIFPFDRIPSYI